MTLLWRHSLHKKDVRSGRTSENKAIHDLKKQNEVFACKILFLQLDAAKSGFLSKGKELTVVSKNDSKTTATIISVYI